MKITRQRIGLALFALSLGVLASATRAIPPAEGTAEGTAPGTARDESAGEDPFELAPIPEEGRLSVFRPTFVTHVEVFGVEIVATARVPKAKILHAARVMARYLDGDEDGVLDKPAVGRVLVEEGAFLVMFATEREERRARIDHEEVEEAGFHLGQDLYAEETLPENPPHVPGRGRFDATLEEVLHLISHGYEEVHPEALAFRPGSRLSEAMDLARGGRFKRVPREYPEEAWYHYDDRSCDYSCMAAEYFYWALTSLLGGQDYPGRAEEIAEEWELPTAALVRERDPAIYALMTDPALGLPRVLPDGSYRVREEQESEEGTRGGE